MKKNKNTVSVFVLSFLSFLFSTFVFCRAVNYNITIGQSITDGETLVSSDGNFELGFFSPQNSELRYVGIRYANITQQALIWIANRDAPISDKNGVFSITEDGNLVVRDGNGNSVWSSNVTITSNSTTAVLDSTGNLILSSNGNVGDSDNAYWQSFHNPTDTFLPSMKVMLGSEVVPVLRSWKSASDPSIGNFTMGLDPRAAPQIVIWEREDRRWRSGHWDSQIFIGVPEMTASTTYRFGFKITQESDGNLSVTYNPSNESEIMRFQMSWDGYEEQRIWNESEQQWDLMSRHPQNDCELYNHCGNFGVCNIRSESVLCSCLDGFEPTNWGEWNRGNWSGGCKRRSQLQCERNASEAEGIGEDGFKYIRYMKLPDFADLGTASSSDDCQDSCLRNCSCNAFAYVTGIGCMIWSGDLIDMQTFDNAGNSLYLRLADSEFGGKKLSTAVIVIIVIAGVIFLATSIWLLWRLKNKFKAMPRIGNHESSVSKLNKSIEYSTDISGPADIVVLEGSQVNGPDLPMFNFNVIATATDYFSKENKLGHGGFGDVFKGKLPGGEEIAVKRLSRISGQGLEEFKNEMILIAKLQHRNLVRLLGCCIHGEEKLLVYEYMPNKSLDCFLFDPEKQTMLNWRQRFAIIEGIARGLLYLHRDSRLRIIHRDLKASNILLDEEMNPKISDFGMARIFGGNQNEANTNRVVGTYGYMSPEYAMEGLFSVKSDVYSFGVLMLEIISGRRNISFRFSDHLSLVAYAWQVWEEGNAMELVDPSIRKSCSESEVLRCIQVGFLCVQDSAIHRPTMDKVLLMLDTESSTSMPLPRAPTFTSMRTSVDTELNLELIQEIVLSNDLTFTSVTGR